MNGQLVRVNRDRLWDTLMRLAQIGSYHDAATGLPGVRRLALTDEDARARRQVIAWMRQAGLVVRIDRIGNVYGRRAGTDADLPCVLMGSHIDTVATGGAFDGTLGVLGGIEVAATLNDYGLATLRPIEVGFFTEEEGVRFGTDMLGSAVTAGRLKWNRRAGCAGGGRERVLWGHNTHVPITIVAIKPVGRGIGTVVRPVEIKIAFCPSRPPLR